MGFSKDFLWGGDISATQIEGGWNEGGKAPVETDYMLAGSKESLRYGYYKTSEGTEGKLMQFSGQLPKGARFIIKDGEIYPNHTAADFYHHYKEDLALLGEMRFKALNLTISWARIYPKGIKGGLNPEGVEFYRSVLTECRKNGMEPIVTLYKYDMPAFYIEEWGGWSNRDLINEYVKFAKSCMELYKDLVKYWITFNELNALKLLLGMNPDACSTDAQRVYEEMHNQLVASARVVKAAHKINPENHVGCMCAGIMSYPLTSDPLDTAVVEKYKQDNFYLFTDVIMRGKYPGYAKRVFAEEKVKLQISEKDQEDLAEGKADFLAFSYYCSFCMTIHPEAGEQVEGNLFSGVKNPYLEKSEWGWQIDPTGLKILLHELYDRYQKPLLIVENGLGAQDVLETDGTVHDSYRIEYMRQHIAKMKEAVEEGVDLFGYTMWSCIDLISFSSGELRKRYGLIYVDADEDASGKVTFNRYRKDSFYWYKKVIETNGEAL